MTCLPTFHAAMLGTLAAVFILALSGCSKASRQTQPSEGLSYRYPSKYYDLPQADIYEFRLDDGTRCVYLPRAGGIACDWKRESVERVGERP